MEIFRAAGGQRTIGEGAMAEQKKRRAKNGTKTKVSEQPQIFAQRKAKPRGRPFPKGNTMGAPRFKKNDPLTGWRDERINRTGRSKLLGESFNAWLQSDAPENPEYSNAEVVAGSVGFLAKHGNIQAVSEMRKATEGEKVTMAGAMNLSVSSIDIIVHDDGDGTDGADTPLPTSD